MDVLTVSDTEELNDGHAVSSSDLLCGGNTNFIHEVDLENFSPLQACTMRQDILLVAEG